MKQRKRRIGTVLLCAMLAISNILSVGVPVYAQAPDTSTDSTNITYENKTVSSLTEDPADGPTGPSRDAADESGDVPDTGNTPGSGTDTGSASDGPSGIDETGNEGSGSSDDSGSDSTDGSGQTPAEDGTDDPDAGAGDSPSSDITNPDGGSGSVSDDGSSSDTDEDTEGGNDTDPDTADDADTEGDTVIPPVSDDTEASSLLQQEANSEYPTEYPQGISMTNISMVPKSYSAVFSANIEYSNVSTSTITPYTSVAEFFINNFCAGLRILYTTEETAAVDFFKGKASATQAEIDSSSFRTAGFQNESGDWYDTDSGEGYKMTCSFFGDGSNPLTPVTVYHYRLAYYSNGSYSFLTVPESFTTLEAITESYISVKDLTVEEIGYQAARIVWTIDNPKDEVISDIRLIYTDGKENGQSGTAYANQYYYFDKNNNFVTVPDKYFADTFNLEWAKDAVIR